MVLRCAAAARGAGPRRAVPRMRGEVHWPSMSPYLGVIIEQSLADPSYLDEVEVVRRQRDPGGSWVFLLVRVPEARAREAFARLRAALPPDERWYAHFFRGSELVVVFRDAVLSMTTDPATWTEAVAHGRALGIPAEQLDFVPHTPAQVKARFGDDVLA